MITIGEGTYINNNFSLVAHKNSIKIGKNCLIGINFQAMSSDFHAIKLEHRNDEAHIKSADVEIGESCFIGNNVIILKGVRLGLGCVVASGSVVTKSFPANSLLGGNPARLL